MCGEQKCNYEHRRHFCPERIKHFTQSGFLPGPRSGQQIIRLDESRTAVHTLFYFFIRDTKREAHPREPCTEVQRLEDIVYLERRESREVARKGER